MNLEFVKREKKLVTLLIVSSILVLTLISILPWISVIETTSSGDTLVSYNMAKMESLKSTDNDINTIQKQLELIIICFWVTVIFGMISLAGTIIYITEKHAPLAHLMMVIGCITTIFSILGTFLLWALIGNINSINNILDAAAFQNSIVTIKYAYFPLAIGIISAIFSAFYAVIIILFSLKHVASPTKQKKSSKKETKIEVDESSVEKKPKPSEQKTTFAESIKAEKAPISEISREPEKPAEPEPSIEVGESAPQKKYFEFDKEQTKKSDSGETSSKELPKSPLFEKALESAIEKRQPDAERKHVEIKKEESPKKKISVRCPQCKTVFTIEKGEKPTNIKCPKCGKTGKSD